MLKMHVHGIHEVGSAMRARRDLLKDLRRAHLQAAILIQQWVFRNFKAQGTMHDSPSLRWRPLSASRIRQRTRPRSATNPSGGTWPGQILAVSGSLRMGFVPNADARSGKVENYVPYAPYHEHGGKRGRPPQRKMFPDEDQARKIVFPIFRDHVKVSIR